MPVIPAGGVEVERREGGIGRPGRGVEIGTALHTQSRVADRRVFENTNWGEAVGTTATGKSGVMEREADVEGDDGVESEDFVHGVLLVC